MKNIYGDSVSVQIKPNDTFLNLKERVKKEAGIELDMKDIALKGKKLVENQNVLEYFLSCK